MKILFRRAFTKENIGWQSSEGIYLSDIRLNRCWEIPKTAKTIWFSLHNRPGKNRYKAKVECNNDGGEYPNITFPYCNGSEIFEDDKLDKHLKPLIGKTVHVEVMWA